MTKTRKPPLVAEWYLDALQFSLTIDQRMEKEFEHLAPHMSTFGMEKPRSISDTLTIPKPVVGSISNWLEYKGAQTDQAKRKLMVELLGGV